MDNFVIVGGGLAGAKATEELRAQGFEGTVTIVGAEPHLPYERPPLSKGYLLGKEPRDKAFVHDAAWWAEHDIDVLSGSPARSIDPAAKTVTLDDDRTLAWDRLLLATGAQPRRVNVPGADAEGVLYLRDIEDSEALHRALEGGGKRVVSVGAGWIGLEVTAAARELGNEVTVIGRETIPLEGPLGEELGSVFLAMHEQHGVRFELPSDLVAFETENGRLTGVVTDRGTIPADLAVVGIGAVPDTALAQAAGLDVDNGIVVDASLATSAPGIFAAGDVANAMHPVLGARMRNEHWQTAISTGRAAARAMLGHDVSFDEIPYFYTDQYDLGMEYSGYGPLTRDARVVYRGDRDGREFIAFWLKDGRVVAGMNVNIWDVNDQVQRLIRDQVKVDEARLTDPSVPLAEL